MNGLSVTPAALLRRGWRERGREGERGRVKKRERRREAGEREGEGGRERGGRRERGHTTKCTQGSAHGKGVRESKDKNHIYSLAWLPPAGYVRWL